MLQTIGKVDPEDINGSATNWRAAEELRPIPLEVVFPSILPRVEQGNQFVGRRINSSNVRSLERIAVEAGESQVVSNGRAVVVLSTNMVDGER